MRFAIINKYTSSLMLSKKRNRPVLSCTNCRGKKRKCDRESPCSTCVRYKLQNSCEYTSTIPLSNVTAKSPRQLTKSANKVAKPPNLTNELLNLKDRLEKIEASITVASLYNTVVPEEGSIEGIKEMISPANGSGKMPQISSDDLIDLYCDFGTKSRAIMSVKRPIPLRTFLKRDPITRLFHKHKQSELFVKFFSLTVLGMESIGGVSASIMNLQAQNHYGAAYIPKVDQKVELADIKKAITLFSSGGMKFKNIDLLANLAQKIIAVIPHQQLFWQLFDSFFATLYPYFPVIDEFEIKEDIARVIKFSGGLVENINVKSKHDLSIIVSVLFILRLSYVSMVIEDRDKSLNDFVAIESVKVAEVCLKELEIYKHNDLSTLQAFILQAIYRTYSPEKGDLSSGAESLLKTGFLIQMAMSMGLNRDPSLFYDLQIDDRLKNLRRKIWHFLISMDEDDSLIYGTPRHINPMSYDTEIPRFSSNMSNIVNIDLEKDVVKAFRKTDMVFKKLKKIKDLTLALNGSVKVEVLVTNITEVEQMLNTDFGSVEELLTEAATSFLSAKKIRLYVLCKVFLMFLNYCLFLFYEGNQNGKAKSFFLKKLLYIMFHDLSRIFSSIVAKRPFIPGFMLYILPTILLYSHLSIMLGTVFSMRIKCIHQKIVSNKGIINKSDPNLYTILEKYTYLINQMRQMIIPRVNLGISLSEKYWVAWNAIKVYIYCLKTLEKEEFFALGIQDIMDDIYEFLEREVDELMEVVTSNSSNTVYLMTDDMSPESVARLVQVDNMWFQLNKIQQEEDAIPKSFTYVNDKPLTYPNFPELENISLFKQDFGLLTGMYFDEYIPSFD